MSRKSPVTGQTLPHTELVPNQSVRTLLKTLIDMTASPTNTPDGAKLDGVCTGSGEDEACGSSGETSFPLRMSPQELPSRSSGSDTRCSESRCVEQWTEQQSQTRASPSSACWSPSAAACSSQSASTGSHGAGQRAQKRTSHQSHQQSSPPGSQTQETSGSGGSQVSPSSACSQQQQLPQAPSTALPPLRVGQGPPMFRVHQGGAQRTTGR